MKRNIFKIFLTEKIIYSTKTTSLFRKPVFNLSLQLRTLQIWKTLRLFRFIKRFLRETPIFGFLLWIKFVRHLSKNSSRKNNRINIETWKTILLLKNLNHIINWLIVIGMRIYKSINNCRGSAFINCSKIAGMRIYKSINNYRDAYL